MDIYGINGTNPAGNLQKSTNLPQANNQSNAGSIFEKPKEVALHVEQTGPNEITYCLAPGDKLVTDYLEANINKNSKRPVEDVNICDMIKTDKEGHPTYAKMKYGEAYLFEEGVYMEATSPNYGDSEAVWYNNVFTSAKGTARVKGRNFMINSTGGKGKIDFKRNETTSIGPATVNDQRNGNNIMINTYNNENVRPKDQRSVTVNNKGMNISGKGKFEVFNRNAGIVLTDEVFHVGPGKKVEKTADGKYVIEQDK